MYSNIACCDSSLIWKSSWWISSAFSVCKRAFSHGVIPDLDVIRNDILLSNTFDPGSSRERLIIGLSDYAELVFGPLIYDAVSRQAPGCQLVFQLVDSEIMARVPTFDDRLSICEPPVPALDFNVEMVSRRRDQQNGKIIWLNELISEIVREHVGRMRTQAMESVQ